MNYLAIQNFDIDWESIPCPPFAINSAILTKKTNIIQQTFSKSY
jgi:hypothetical protein